MTISSRELTRRFDDAGANVLSRWTKRVGEHQSDHFVLELAVQNILAIQRTLVEMAREAEGPGGI